MEADACVSLRPPAKPTAERWSRWVPVDTGKVSADLMSLVDKPKAPKEAETNGFFGHHMHALSWGSLKTYFARQCWFFTHVNTWLPCLKSSSPSPAVFWCHSFPPCSVFCVECDVWSEWKN